MEYRHRQFGTVITAALAAGIILVYFPILKSREFYLIRAELLILVVTAIALFNSLEVEVNATHLICRMGIGLIQKRIPLADIEQARTVQNPVYAGWGIHWMPGRYWLWSVSGLRGVELTLKNGRRFRIGTDEPEALVFAIESSAAAGLDPQQQTKAFKNG